MSEAAGYFFAAANNLQQIADNQYRRILAEEELWTQTRIAEARNSLVDYMVSNQEMGTGYTAGVFNHIDTLQKNTMEIAPSQRVRDQLVERFAALRAQNAEVAMRTEAKVISEQNVSLFQNRYQLSMDRVAKTDGSPKSLLQEQGELYALAKQLHDAAVIDTPIYDKMRKMTADLGTVAAEARISVNIDEAEQIIRETPGIDWDRRDSVLRRIEQARKTTDHLSPYEANKALDEARAYTQANGRVPENFTPELYAARFPKDEQAKYLDIARVALSDAKILYSVNKELDGATPKKMQELRERFSQEKIGYSTDHARIEDQVGQIIDANMRAIKRDSFSYAARDAVLQDVYRKAEMMPDGKVKEAELRRALDLNVEHQRSALGVVQPKVMQNERAAAIAQQINTGKPSEVKGAFSMMMQEFGGKYPDAIRQLVTLEQEPLKPAMQIVALHMDKPWLDEFIQAVQADPKSLKLPEQADETTLEQAFSPLGGNSTVVDFFQSMILASPKLAGTVQAYADAYAQYAKYLVVSGRATKNNVVKQVVERVIKTEYAFDHVNGQPIIIRRSDPREGNPSHKWSDEEVSQIVDSYKTLLKMPYVRDQIDRKYLVGQEQPGLQDVALSKILANNAYWVMSPEQDGLILYAPSIQDRWGAVTAPQPVLRPNGTPVKVTFNQAFLEYGKKLTPQQSAEELERNLRGLAIPGVL